MRRLGRISAGFLFLVGTSVVTFSAPESAAAASDGASLYWGAYLNGAPFNLSVIDDFEAQVGKHMSIVHWGQPWQMQGGFQPFQTQMYEVVKSRGAIPMIDWGSWNLGQGDDESAFRLAAVATGKYDAYITEWARSARAWGGPFFLRFDWEMNGYWQFPWAEQLNNNQPGDYVRAWRHVHDIFAAQGANNVTWVWCPNISSAKTLPLSQVYPGDNYVDWTCMDGYNFGTVDAGGEWQSFAQVFSGSPFNVNHNTYAELISLAPQKPIMIGETASSEIGGSKAAWISDMLNEVPSQYPQVKALMWFNWSDSGAKQAWPVTSSPEAKHAFSNGIAAAAYAGNEFGSVQAMATIPPLPSSPAAPAQQGSSAPDQTVVQPGPADNPAIADDGFADISAADYSAEPASEVVDLVDTQDGGD